MNIETHYTDEELDRITIDEICGFDHMAEAIRMAKLMELHAVLEDIGMQFDLPLDTLESYERVARNGVIAERVKMYDGEANIFEQAFEIYKRVCNILK